MTINKTQEASALTLSLIGRLDTTTVGDLEAILENDLKGITDLVFDLSELEYISSAGLRALLKAQKTMDKQGTMKVLHANEMVLEIFDVTGFSEILTVE